MYSNSSSFLGAGNSNRPGPPQYGQPPFSNPQQLQQQMTGYQVAPLQGQYTGYPGGAMQQQGYQQTGVQNGPVQQQQQQQQQQLQSSQPPQPISPLRTGHTSSQIAQSFQGMGQPRAPAMNPATTGVKIPKIRLSFLTVQDQAKFEQLFKSAVGEGQALDGDKVRDLLIRSKLPGSDLMHIWVLADTTKSGQLLFPEFALAMYLCNLRIVGKELPQALPERIANEVSSMVDIISFGVPDDRGQVAPQSNVPNFNMPPSIQQPRPQTSNTQLLTQLTSQPTGFVSQYIPPQPTGFQPQPTGFPQLQQQQQQQTSQQTSYLGAPSMPPMPSIPTGFAQSQVTSALPLNAQPTGIPGQWGLVNAPASGLPNIEALQQRMMPQPGREGGFTTSGLTGQAHVPWAVTKEEKKIYDSLFKAWDGLNKGFMAGDVAIEVLGQSGLPKSDLEKIWTLSDPGNRGKLDIDEFAVAMHLIYRKLNGYPVPNRLPPELVPPSTRNLADSIGTMKSLLSQDAETRKNTGAFLQPQKTGVSYLKSHSLRGDLNGANAGRKDATVFRNNDDDVGYKSSVRRRLGAGGKTPSPRSASPSSELSNDELTLEQLRKRVREKQILLDAMDFQDENDADEDDALDRKDRREAEDLYRSIRRIQEDIDRHPAAALRNVDSEAERRTMKRQLQSLTDRLPELASNVRRTERSIADTSIELFRLKDAKAHPGSASAIIGTGPGGSVTEADRLKARAKAMMQQRSAALTGKPIPADNDDASSASRRLEEENSKIRTEKENNERMIRDVEDSVRDYSRSLEDSLKQGAESSATEHERRRWEDGLGVEDEVKDFIFDLQRSSRAARLRHEDTNRERQDGHGPRPSAEQTGDRNAPAARYDSPSSRSPSSQLATTPSSTGASSYSSYKTAEERAAFIKQQAEQRMAERLAALGLKAPSKPGESTQQKTEREAKERDERRRQAEAEDAKRDQERQRRLADEQPTPPSTSKLPGKRPPPPPSRRTRGNSLDQQADAQRKTEEEATRRRAEQEGKEEAIRGQQLAQENVTRKLEDDTLRQEEELAREQEAQQTRLKAMEDQVKAGKLKKQEEKRRRQAAEKEAQEKQSRLATRRAELEAAKERERQLQLQLENLDEDSSDEEGPQQITAQEATPTSNEVLPTAVSQPPVQSSLGPSDPSPPTVPALLSAAPSHNPDTKNPFLKKLSQPSESGATLVPLPGSTVTSPGGHESSNNPFHRLTQQENAGKPAGPLVATPTGNRPSRIRPEEDEWSVVDSNGDSSDDESDGRPTGGSAKQLASMLFGTMGPPRPLSATDEPKSPQRSDQAFTAPMSPFAPVAADAMPATAPPLPPLPPADSEYDVSPPSPSEFRMPGAFDPEPDVPPPPPPPMPSFSSAPSGAPPPPPLPAPSAAGKAPTMGALLGEIQKGKGLKKVQTIDRSQASTTGRVLD